MLTSGVSKKWPASEGHFHASAFARGDLCVGSSHGLAPSSMPLGACAASVDCVGPRGEEGQAQIAIDHRRFMWLYFALGTCIMQGAQA